MNPTLGAILIAVGVFFLLGTVIGLFGYVGPWEALLMAIVAIAAALVYRRRATA